MIESLAVESRALEYFERRKRRRLLWILAGCGTLALVILLLATTSNRAIRHLSAASRLQVNGFEVDWYSDPRPFWKGGSCTVTYHARAYQAPVRLSRRELEDLKDLARIEVLDFTGYPFLTDLEVPALRTLNALQELRIPSQSAGRALGPITDRALETISRMKSLRILSLTGQRITDAGIPQLLGLDEVEELDLDHTLITDAGVAAFASLPKLKYLRLGGTKVTPTGIANLQRLAPQVTVLTLGSE